MMTITLDNQYDWTMMANHIRQIKRILLRKRPNDRLLLLPPSEIIVLHPRVLLHAQILKCNIPIQTEEVERVRRSTLR